MRSGTIECGIFAASLCALVFLPVPAFSEDAPHSYRNREAGTDAAAAGDYAVAADFYRHYAFNRSVIIIVHIIKLWHIKTVKF